MIRVSTLFAGLLLTTSALSSEGWYCWQEASDRYGVPVDLLYSVAMVETGNKAKIVSKANKNGSYDIGLMQINSSHLKRLANYGISEKDLLDNACLNLHVGAWIMSDAISRHGFNWKGVGAYNAASPDKRRIYAEKVLLMYDKIVNKRNSEVVNVSY
jgi:soluble lytic murein transglycosylase-like protein